MEPRIPGTAEGRPNGANDYVRRLADAAEAKGLEILSIDGDMQPWAIELQTKGVYRGGGSVSEVRITIRGVRLLEALEALPSFQEAR